MSDGVRPSGMLRRLEAEMAAARSERELDCKRAERAAYLSRLGRDDKARSELQALRRKYESNPNAKVSAWLNLVAGIVAYFGEPGSDARGLLLRSHALSVAADLPFIRALSAAWLADVDEQRADPASMNRYVREALQLSSDDAHPVRSRVGLVIARSLHGAGRIDLAQPWYADARAHAVAEGDDTALSASMHQMAWLRVRHARAEDCGLSAAGFAPDQAPALRLLADSAANFDALIGSTSRTAAIPLLRAQILVVETRHAEAVAQFDQRVAAAQHDPAVDLGPDLWADRAWCKVHLDEPEAALESVAAAEMALVAGLPADRRAIIHARLAGTLHRLGQSGAAARHRDRARTAWLDHTSHQQQIIGLLEGLKLPECVAA